MPLARRQFNPHLFQMDDGKTISTEGLSPTGMANLGQQAYNSYQTSERDRFIADQMSGKSNASNVRGYNLGGASPAGSMWDSYSGFMRGRMLGNQSQGVATMMPRTRDLPRPDVDTRFDPDQVDAGSGKTLMEDARLKNPAALKALTDYLMRGGR